jgi:hypothetical protein
MTVDYCYVTMETHGSYCRNAIMRNSGEVIVGTLCCTEMTSSHISVTLT